MPLALPVLWLVAARALAEPVAPEDEGLTEHSAGSTSYSATPRRQGAIILRPFSIEQRLDMLKGCRFRLGNTGGVE